MGKIPPGTEEADTGAVLKAMCAPTCLAIQRQTEEAEEKLEELMPEVDIPRGEEVISRIDELELLTKDQNNDIGELFKNLEVAHEHMAHSCGLLDMLSWSLTLKQLLLLMKASIHLLVQVNAMAGFMDEPAKYRRKIDLPESRPKCVKIMMILDPASKSIKD